jgi:hypothetical protein
MPLGGIAGKSGGSSSGSSGSGGNKGVQQSSIDKPAGTLTRTSAETGQVFESVGERKVAGIVSQVERLGEKSVGIGKITPEVYSQVKRFIGERDRLARESQVKPKSVGGEIKSVVSGGVSPFPKSELVSPFKPRSTDVFGRPLAGIPISEERPSFVQEQGVSGEENRRRLDEFFGMKQKVAPTSVREIGASFVRDVPRIAGLVKDVAREEVPKFVRGVVKGSPPAQAFFGVRSAVDFLRGKPYVAPPSVFNDPEIRGAVLTSLAFTPLGRAGKVVSPVVSRVVRVLEPVVERGVVKSLVGRELVSAGSVKVAGVVEKKVVERGVESVASKLVSQESRFKRFVGMSEGLPRFVVQSAAGQVGLGLGLTAIRKASGEREFGVAQESQRELVQRFGFDFKPPTGLGDVKSSLTDGSLKKLGTSFVLEFGLGRQFLRRVSPSFAREEEVVIREIGGREGLKGKELEDFVGRVRETSSMIGFAESASQVFGVETATELLGRESFGKLFSKKVGERVAQKEVSKELFKLSFPRFFAFGVGEGSSEYFTKLQTRGYDFSALDLAKSGVIGGFTAGVLGSGAFSFRPTRPVVSRVFSGVGQVLDAPQELLGDISANVARRVQRRVGVRVLEPVVEPVVKKGERLGVRFGVRELGMPVRVRTPSLGVGGNVKTSQEAVANAQKSMVEVLSGGRVKDGGVSVPSPSVSPVIDDSGGLVPSPVPTPSESPVESPLEALVPTGVNVPTAVGLPTNVFGLRGFVPPPFPFPSGGSGGVGVGRGRVFRNELQASLSLFGQQVRFGFGNLFKPVKPLRKSKRKGRKK